MEKFGATRRPVGCGKLRSHSEGRPTVATQQTKVLDINQSNRTRRDILVADVDPLGQSLEDYSFSICWN